MELFGCALMIMCLFLKELMCAELKIGKRSESKENSFEFKTLRIQILRLCFQNGITHLISMNQLESLLGFIKKMSEFKQ